MASKLLPPMAPFPEAAWRNHMVPEEWEACLDAWIMLAEAHLSLSDPDFLKVSAQDDSLSQFLISYTAESALPAGYSDAGPKAKELRKDSFLLVYRLLGAGPAPEALMSWEFLSDSSKVYSRKHAQKLLESAWKRNTAGLEASLGHLKTSLIKLLDAGLKGNVQKVEADLKRLNHLLHASPDAAAFFLAGSDFLDGLISCYKVMNPPLRKAIISTTYLCLVGLTEGEKPNFSSLVDQLYSLKSAAEAHKAGPTNVNDSLVAELITVTPILKQVQQRIESSGSGSSRVKSVLAGLEGFKKAGAARPPRLIKRKINKGKGIANAGEDDLEMHGQVHIHRMSLITQIQDLFPELGSGFVVRLLDEYNDDVEQVISHLLEESLPEHLRNSDRSEAFQPAQHRDPTPDLAPHPTPPQLPVRHNVYDDDEFDNLNISTSKLHLGRRNPDQTADDVLQDRSTAPNKAAILSALAAFDSDDDERDDTYDVEDVGGTVDSTNPEETVTTASASSAHDEVLFRTWKATPAAFERDANTRRSTARITLREATGMTDEALEGWAVMLSRDARRQRRLEAQFESFAGAQRDLKATAWRADKAGSGAEESDADARGTGQPRGRGRGRGRGGRGRGNVAGPTGDKETEVARHRKEANKGSRANHNRRDQRAKKMARGGFPG
ncbi:CUE-containing protein [Coleophoma cylindrospora]|uniref:CUE-containing protein n=1 Tax=Coleophoma cylindrospora TaxID=1849047 RepID=A0A3D8R1X3_9HELO|nr:CUE-containing protein [Coleophoma cylindrospora]